MNHSKTASAKKRTLNDVLEIAHQLSEYKYLARMVGNETADSALAMTYSLDSKLAQGDANTLSKDMREMLQKESDDIHAGQRDLERIMRETLICRRYSKKQPSDHVDDVYDPQPLYAGVDLQFLKPSDYGAHDQDPDEEKAAKWVTFKSASLTPEQNGDVNFAAIVRIKAAIKSGLEKDLWDEAFPKFLHAACAPQGTYDKQRGIMLGAKYPSTAGGQYLIKEAYARGIMRRIPKPGLKSARWHDVAGLLFGMIIRAHSFSDGNGRVARAAYCVAIIQGGLYFAAPTTAIEDEMCKL
jgi:Fic/DOC family